ncbi:MAG: YeaH/YhbH family protein [Burkholderiales bacterium]|nr:MAG: YeaH/YhbH family protein [Burkholderiales bacterium]
MSEIIDRRANGRRKSAGNQQRFLKRYKAQVREAVARAVAQRKIADTDKGGNVTIPARDLTEPNFSLGPGGRRERVLPGNKEFTTGDKIPRPQGGGGGGGSGKAGDSGESEDAFTFALTREEFLEFFFEDMALPDLVKTQLAQIPQTKLRRGGFRSDGTPSNLSIMRTMRESLARRIALAAPYRAQLREVYERIAVERRRLAATTPVAPPVQDDAAATEPEDAALQALLAERDRLLGRIARVPFIDEFDLRFNNRVQQPKPVSQAVMLCVMDVSGSMDENRKDLAKRFFILLHLFLTRHYERIEIVFIRHHTTAAVVDEDGFFHSRESGGTLVSSALELAVETIKERFPLDQWNVYVAQASDGDNWESDCPKCHELLVNELLPRVQYYCYIEIDAAQPQSLWEQFELARSGARNLAMGRIMTRADVYPVLRELFARKQKMAA